MKAKTVTVQSAQLHTYSGKAYKTGQKYEVPEELVDTLVAQGKAMRVQDPKKVSAPKSAKKGTYSRRDMRAKKK